MKQWLFLLLACLGLFILWIPGLQYPIVSDSAQYALLGESVWQGNGYQLFGVPYAKHLPLHALFSYPLVWIFGHILGMKLASLLGGFGVLIATYLLGRDYFSKAVGIGAVLVVLFHHGFIWMTIVGSADLLFTALFLFGLLAFGRAKDDDRWYLLAGLLWGLACLTRYNGMPLFGLYVLYGIFARKEQRTMNFWCGLLLGSGLFSIWLLRNFHIFGNPLHTEYTGELGAESAGPVAQFVSNFFYYMNPLQNILPVLFIFSLFGLWKKGKEHRLFVWAMVAIWMLTAIWWVQAMRFAFPAYPLLIMFGIWALAQFKIHYSKFIIAVITALVASHLGAMCLYTYGSCNALFDRTIGIIPPNLGITSEGFYTFDAARDYINNNAKEGEYVLVSDETKPIVWKSGVFREDLYITTDASACPHYRITPEPKDTEEVIYTTEDHPQTSVVLHRC